MRHSYHDQLAELTSELVAMARVAESSVRGATAAIADMSLEQAEAVISGDRQLNELHHAVDAHALDLLARQQPVASDLRSIVTAVRMSSDLERVGDYAVHLAKIARRRHPAPAVPDQLRGLLQELGQTCVAITAAAGDVIQNRDLGAAGRLLADDDAVDDLHRRLLDGVLAGDPELTPEQIVDVTLIGRYFERLADHAVAVSQAVAYIVTGQHDALDDDSEPPSSADD